MSVILATLEELVYSYTYEVLNAKYFGVAQNRERLFIIAWFKELIDAETFKFPYGISPEGKVIYNKAQLKQGTLSTRVSDIFEPEETTVSFTISDRMWIGHQERKERKRRNGKRCG